MLEGAAPSAPLQAALDPIWASAPGGCVTVADGDTIVYESGADVLAPPASAVKVITAAAALEGIGADERLRTSVRSGAAPVDGVVRGDLALVGGGDPVLGTDAWAAAQLAATAPRTSLDALADAVVAAGVRQIAGAVVGVDSRYDAQRRVATWPQRLVEDGEAGPLSALVVNDGFEVWGHPGVPFADPPAGAARLFHDLLSARGVAIDGGWRSGTADGAVELAAIESPTVRDLTTAMLRDSDNGTAELLVKELGRRHRDEGSTAAGLDYVVSLLRQRGVALRGAVIGDGSGLSDATRVSCRALSSVLTAWAGDLHPALPVAGRDGTLRRRLVGTPAEGRVRGKTGSLDGVSSLAGYVDAADGRAVAFSAIVTGFPAESAAGRDVVDASAIVLATSFGGRG